MSFPPIITKIIKANLQYIRTDTNSTLSASDVKLPRFTINELTEVLNAAKPIFEKEGNILQLYAPMIVVGSLHGSIFNLYQIISRFGLPPTRSYLFLGNFIGDGEFSLETAVFLYALKIVYPRNIYILRGLNEIGSFTRRTPLFHEMEELDATKSMFNLIEETFSFLPLAANLFDSLLCVSGGLTPGIKSIKDINLIPDQTSLAQFFAAEPTNSVTSFRKDRISYFYGLSQFDNFISSNSISLLVSGNIMVPDGYRYSFGNRLISLFSCSNYNKRNNSCGVLAVFGAADYKTMKMPKIPFYTRASISFVSLDDFEADHPKPQQMQILSLPKISSGASTTRRTAMRILDTSRDSIPSGHPILTLFNGADKLSKISRIRTFGTSRAVPPAAIGTFF